MRGFEVVGRELEMGERIGHVLFSWSDLRGKTRLEQGERPRTAESGGPQKATARLVVSTIELSAKGREPGSWSRGGLLFEAADQVSQGRNPLTRHRVVDGGAEATDRAVPLEAFHAALLGLGQKLGLELGRRHRPDHVHRRTRALL